ncbi:MAG: bifunctional folylpolyglutamate synthase/dihydrofolate synthase [Salinivirgaceae bacterium]|jgi:dihydrofolate synthase/folylpolyglutamate synthase|nr:bifunctional folylpolyglutamate synthase/dihydrofolate synthase [Salinivirgaceae bacterium]
MDYKQTIQYLFSQLPMYQRDGKAAYKANLNNTLALDKHFDYPHRNFQAIHVAGTNGKGSVSHMIASILQEAGLKTGLYTSPHLLDFRERIKINGQMISEEDVVDFVTKNKDIIDELGPSFFEMTVAMAFNYFKEQMVDVAVIEVGMGGRLDSTNIINPVVSIITNIGLDHTSFLGKSLSEIAQEKAGIIKEEVPVIIGELNEDTEPVFRKKAEEKESFICFSERRFSIRDLKSAGSFQEIAIRNEQSGTTYTVSLDLIGHYQKRNIIPVFGALQVLIPYFNIPKHAIISGLSKVIINTKLLGRWFVVQDNPKVICDTGHNKEGLNYVFEQLKNEQYLNLHIVFGTVDDKDVDSILRILPQGAQYYFTQAEIPRAYNSEKLAKVAAKLGFQNTFFSNVPDAFLAAKIKAKPNDLIFVGGSTFVVADLLKYLQELE